MNKLLRCTLLAALPLVSGCRHEADPRPATYDELALGTGHWEWDSWKNGFTGARTPATERFTQQLTFGAGGRLTVSRNGQVVRQARYQLSVGTFNRCGRQLTSIPLITFANEAPLVNDEAKTYDLTSNSGTQILTLIGKETCVDYGASETYHWVKEQVPSLPPSL